MKIVDCLPSLAEFLTVAQFADRLQVSRTTVFAWLKNGELQEGFHYLRLGRILRFRWQEGLFFNRPAMPETCAEAAPLPPLPGTSLNRRKRLCRGKGTTPVINLDYQ
jgi:excisionase family DNA binding protein